MQFTIEAITAATIAAVDRHLASIGLYPRFDPASSHNTVNTNRPSVASASIATPPPPAGSVAPTTNSTGVSTSNAYPLAAPALVSAPPPPRAPWPPPRISSLSHRVVAHPCNMRAQGFHEPRFPPHPHRPRVNHPRPGPDELFSPYCGFRVYRNAPTACGLRGPNRETRPSSLE